MLDTIAGAALLGAGRVLSRVQVLFRAEAPTRGLTGAESSLLESIFHESLAVSEIRIVEGRAGLFGVTDRPFTLGNTIYMQQTPEAEWLAVLVHECTHVWQFQKGGPGYIGAALRAQFTLGSDAHGLLAYRWQRELPKPWRSFNPEAQAQVIEDLYRFGGLAGAFKIPASMTAHGYSAGDFTSVAREALATVRGAELDR